MKKICIFLLRFEFACIVFYILVQTFFIISQKTKNREKAMNLQESETKLNLLRAFAGESQARNRYTFAASLAKKQNL